MLRSGSRALLPVCLLVVAAGAVTPAGAISADDARTKSFKLQSDGMRLYKEGKYRAATEAFQQVVNLNLNSFLAYYYLGSSLLAERRYAESIDPLKIALDLEPDYIQAHLALGNAYLKLGDAGEARAEYLRVLDQQPNFAAAYDGLGQLFESIGKDEQAEEQYRRALSINIAFADAYTHLGDLYLRKDRVDEAIDLFLKSISVKPDFSRGYTRLGRAYARQRLFDEAIAATRTSQILTPEDPEPYVALGRIYLELESYLRAEAEIQAALSFDHDHPGAHLILAALKRAQEDFPAAEEVLLGLHERGIEDAQMRRAVADALDALRADSARYVGLRDAIVAGQEDPQRRVAMARFLSGLGSHLRAATLLLDAARMTTGLASIESFEIPDRPDLDLTPAIGEPSAEAALAVDGDPIVAADSDAQSDTDLEPDDPVMEADTGAASNMAVGGGTAEAIGPTVEGAPVSGLDPSLLASFHALRFEAAVELLTARRFPAAIEIFTELGSENGSLAPDDPLRAAALFNLGVARASLGMNSAAIAIFEEILRDHPGDADAHLYLGNAYLRNGRRGDARASYVAFLEHSVGAPETGRIRRLLQKLDRGGPESGDSGLPRRAGDGGVPVGGAR